MKVGVLIGGGDHSVRAAHSLAADPLTEMVVVVGPAKSRSFKIVDDPSGLDVLVGSGPDAPKQARGFDLPLIWDGTDRVEGVRVWGASVSGLAPERGGFFCFETARCGGVAAVTGSGQGHVDPAGVA